MDLALAFEDSQPFKLTVDQYRDLLEQGVVDEGAKIPLGGVLASVTIPDLVIDGSGIL